MRNLLVVAWVVFMLGYVVPTQASSSLRWKVQEFKVVHENPRDPKFFNGATDDEKDKIIENYLKDVGQHLQSKGFSNPMLPLTEDGKKYIVHLSKLEDDAAPGSTVFSRKTSDVEFRNILLSTPVIYGTHETELTPEGYVTLGHELFHAIQNSYKFFTTSLERQRQLGTWIIEGTAFAFGFDMAFRFAPSSVMAKIDTKSKYFDPGGRWGGRKYSTELRRINHYSMTNHYTHLVDGNIDVHEIVKKMEGATSYRTSSFWKHLDEYIGTSKKPTSHATASKADYGYLADFFSNDLPTYGTKEEKELEWLDNNLATHTNIGRSLADIYPEFITTLAHYIPDRANGKNNPYSAYNNDKEANLWKLALFDQCKQVNLSATQTSAKVDLIFHKVSAACIDVTYTGTAPTLDIGIYLDSQDQRTIRAIKYVGVQYKTPNLTPNPTKSIKLLTPGPKPKQGVAPAATTQSASNKKITQWIFPSVPFHKTSRKNTFIISNAAKNISESLDNETITFRVEEAVSTGSTSMPK